VADKLEELFKNNREDFEKKWDDIKIFIEYGMLSDEKFYERAEKFALFKNTDDKYFTFDEYKTRIEPLQKDKDKTLVYLYATNKDEQYSYIAKAKEKGYDVLLMDSILDSHFVNLLERRFQQTRFVRVDSDVVEKLIPKEDKIPEKLSEQEKEKLKPIIEKQLDTKKYTVLLESLEETDQPMVITQNEFMRRYKEMSMIGGGGMGFYGELPESYNLVVNVNHPLIEQVLKESDAEKQKQLVHQLTDLALLANGLLKGEALTEFVKRSISMI
jgi:molecular chaperone HtpG